MQRDGQEKIQPDLWERKGAGEVESGERPFIATEKRYLG